jgi:hypothetical protein
MDTDTLVEDRIRDGRKLVEELARQGFDLTAALWLQASDDGKWRFYIVSSMVDDDGLTKAYRKLHPLVRAMPQPFWIDPLEIRLIGPTNPIAQDALAIHRRAPGPQVSPLRWGGTKLGNLIIEGAYLYPLPATTPYAERRPKGKRPFCWRRTERNPLGRGDDHFRRFSGSRRLTSVVILRPVNLRWIQGAADDAKDLCAHGDVEFCIGDDVLLDPTTGRDLPVSAAALYLLRTLSVPHTHDKPVGDRLFPCCGFAMYDVGQHEDVVICGCPNGEDFEVFHQVSGAGVVVRAADGREWRVGWLEWRAAVFGFADKVSEFYGACCPKEPYAEEDAKGFRKFAAEWGRRRGRELAGTILQTQQPTPKAGISAAQAST